MLRNSVGRLGPFIVIYRSEEFLVATVEVLGTPTWAAPVPIYKPAAVQHFFKMSSSSPSIAITTLDPSLPAHKALIPAITAIHIACIEMDGTISTFAPPLDRERIERWWAGKIEDVRDGSRIIFLAFDAAEEELVGFVVLHRPMLETGPFKASVEKLMVSPAHRRLGIGRKLMERLETDAKALGQTLIQLDTDEGSAAESLYTKLGYNILGVIPDHGISPLDGSLRGSTFFWKRL
uniref:N-acetyltransferase domain-containing protein n=1 Tax=Mycena chlorophos TaxID=658473 RepID=A0ABQ0LHQ7_MYCCL|nr:predicted protein [Mycena chlorophos]